MDVPPSRSGLSRRTPSLGQPPIVVHDAAKPPGTHTAAGTFIRTATPSDLPETARLCIEELPVGLFPRLGRGFVARWHLAFVESPYAIALVAVERGSDGRERVVGFLVGATDRHAFRADVLTRHRTALLCRGVIALLQRPSALARFLRTRMRPYLRRLTEARPGRAVTNPELGAVGAIGELTAIAVAAPLRRGGTGRGLVEVFLHRCAMAGTPWVELVTAVTSTEATEFYLRTGWTALDLSTTHDGVLVQRFGRRPPVAEAG